MVRCSSWQFVAVCWQLFVFLWFLVGFFLGGGFGGSWLFLVIISGYLWFMVALGGYWCSWYMLVLFGVLGGLENPKLLCCTTCGAPYTPRNGYKSS